MEPLLRGGAGGGLRRAILLLWQKLEHHSASVRASVSIALLEKTDRILSRFEAITLLADRAFPCDELIAWLRGRSRWYYVMRLRGDTEIQGTEVPLGYQVRRLQLPAITVGASVACSSGPMAARRRTC